MKSLHPSLPSPNPRKDHEGQGQSQRLDSSANPHPYPPSHTIEVIQEPEVMDEERLKTRKTASRIRWTTGILSLAALCALFVVKISFPRGQGIKFHPFVANPKYEVTTCATPECQQAVRIVRSSMNQSFDPCQDFYLYACGGWIQHQFVQLRATGDTANITQDPVPLNNPYFKLITKLIDDLNFPEPVDIHSKNIEYKIKRLHNSCLNAVNFGEAFDRTEWESIWRDIRNKFSFDSEPDTEKRSDICAYILRKWLPEGVAKLFVTSHYLNDPNRNEGANELIHKIVVTFLNMTPSVDTPWIADILTKENITEMAIMGPNYLGDILVPNWVANLYANVSISDDFSHNLHQLVETRKQRKKKSEAYYFYSLGISEDTSNVPEIANEPVIDRIIIPTGIIGLSTFHQSLLEVFKFAKLGRTMAHSFAHLLDDYIDGYPDAGISPADTPTIIRTREDYRRRRKCFSDQSRTQGLKENIADILAIQIAFKSFMDNVGASFQPIPGLSEEFSKEQIFFIAAVQRRCEAFLGDENEVKLLKGQVNGNSPRSIDIMRSLQNYDEFSKAFSCPLGSRYNPGKKCPSFIT